MSSPKNVCHYCKVRYKTRALPLVDGVRVCGNCRKFPSADPPLDNQVAFENQPNLKSNVTSIHKHEGKKYIRRIRSAVPCSVESESWIEVDVYAVLEAFGVTCPGRQQAIKKLLCAGLRGKGSQLEDLIGALAALTRAIELQRQREGEEV